MHDPVLDQVHATMTSAAAVTAPDDRPPAGTSMVIAITALVITAIFLVSLVPALVVPMLGLLPAALAALLAGLVAGLLAPTRTLRAIAVALVAASLVTSSQLLPSSGRYLPMLGLSAALVAGSARELYQGRLQLRMPPRILLVPLLAYVVVAVIATTTSIDPGTSAVYAAGIAASLTLAMVVVPAIAGDALGIRSFLAGVAGVAVAVAASSLVLIVAGPWTVYGQHVGLFEITEILIADRPIGLIVARATGPFFVPADMGIALAVGLVALLALRSDARPRAKAFYALGLGLVSIGLLITMGRNGWLVAIAATGAYAVGTALVRRLDRAAVLVTGLFVAVFVLVTLDVIGASLRYDLATARYGPELARLLPGAAVATPIDEETGVQFRGGADLSGRPALWRASIDAIRDRPLTGWGPGTNPNAISPYLTDGATIYRGLLSHNTWLRTGVELGIPGLVVLVGVILASALAMLRSLRVKRRDPDRPAKLALFAMTLGILAAQACASFILGGLSFPSFAWVLSVGLLVSAPIAVTWPGRARGAPAESRAAPE
jgi:hypothetical protein